jgi:hypothetical protein
MRVYDSRSDCAALATKVATFNGVSVAFLSAYKQTKLISSSPVSSLPKHYTKN